VNFTSSSVSVVGLATMPRSVTCLAWHFPSNAHAYRLYVVKDLCVWHAVAAVRAADQ
jgi:hypothetical protein